MPVSRRNIGHSGTCFRCYFNDIACFGRWTENPRVGGSIPPLATIKIRILRRPQTSPQRRCFHFVSIPGWRVGSGWQSGLSRAEHSSSLIWVDANWSGPREQVAAEKTHAEHRQEQQREKRYADNYDTSARTEWCCP